MEVVMSDQCEHIRDQIRALELQVDLLQEELKTAAGALKQALIFLIKRTQAEIAEKEGELKECEAVAEPPLSDPKVFGSEITQGLPEYELVAGKDTFGPRFRGRQTAGCFARWSRRVKNSLTRWKPGNIVGMNANS
jgi:hypothetical protein